MTDEEIQGAEVEGVELSSLTRTQLNDLAGELGLDYASSLNNKEAVIAEIEKAQKEASGKVSSGDDSDDESPTGKYIAITFNNGQTFMPGELLDPDDDDPSWPERRAKQLVNQGYMKPAKE